MHPGFRAERLDEGVRSMLVERRRHAAADVVRLTTLANSGHPGGSLSTLDALLVIYGCGTFDPRQPMMPARDRVVVSHGHISPGVYATLGRSGFFDMAEAYAGFRRVGSVFGGHIESVVPGVEWNTGNLGQGLSAGCGYAMAAKLRGDEHATFVLMGDGEQQKGQLSEARRYAVKFGLTSLVGLVDVNGLQIGGDTDDIMPMDLAAIWRADGWDVREVDGHDFEAIYAGIRHALREGADAPTVLLLDTVMGKGIPEIENLAKFHGQALTPDMAARAFAHLGVENDLDSLRALRGQPVPHRSHEIAANRDIRLDVGAPVTYGTDVKTDCRSAYGNALKDLAVRNGSDPDASVVVGISCDLEGSVKMNGFHAATPDRFIEVGISEHHAAVLAGVLSKEGIVPFYSTFGMFGVVEGYNQQRLNDQNGASPNVVVTHCGLDVGEDGPTHQCIDYVALLRNLYGFEIFVPADPNECDRIIRTVATRYAPTCVAMGRSKLPVIANSDGTPALGGEHVFRPGTWAQLRDGDDVVVFAVGPTVWRAVEAADQLRGEGIAARVVNASSLKPFDRAAILAAADEVGRIVTVEDHNVDTGLGAIVASTLGDAGVAARLTRLGVSRYGTSGPSTDLFVDHGIDTASIVGAVRALHAG
jgi:transketolase